MPTYEIEHKWTNGDSARVMEKIREIASKAKSREFPSGLRPIAIVGPTGKDELRSVWEAPNEESLESLYKTSGLATNRTIRMVNPYFVA